MQGQITFGFFPPAQRLSRTAQLQKGVIPEHLQGDQTVYLLHFSKPLGSAKHQARHYTGIVRDTNPDNLRRRLRQHNKRGSKNSSKITSAAKQHNCKLELAMVWTGVNAEFERYLKRWKSAKTFCPFCQELPFF